jgi:ankyrin repeat protein
MRKVLFNLLLIALSARGQLHTGAIKDHKTHGEQDHMSLYYGVRNGALLQQIVALLVQAGSDPEQILKDMLDHYQAMQSDPNSSAQGLEWLQLADELKSAQAYLEKIIRRNNLKKAGEELTQQTFPQIAALFKPSDSRLIAIKHAIEDENLGALAIALENGRWLELKDATGYTPFLYAAYLGKEKAMKFLIEAGADVNAQTKDGAKATDFGD